MKAVTRFLLTIALLGLIGFEVTQLASMKPCRKPISYTLAGFDTRFGISREDFLAEAAQAANLWNTALAQDGKSPKVLLAYDPIGTSKSLKVNLTYDDRQETTQKNKILDTSIEQGRMQAEQIKASYEALKREYDARSAAYDADVAVYKNSHGQSGDYEALEQERLALNALADRVNAGVRDYNAAAQSINADIRNFNENAGEEFEEGIYSSASNSITIYQFEDKHDLLRVLAHEFGHALGLDHTGNRESIMYGTNSGSSESLSAEDKAALEAVCNPA